jgi:hypothetical protein
MPKTFFTERDIEDLFQRGTHSIAVSDDVVLTELAYEKAKELGMDLLQATDTPPAAPVRPYIAKPLSSNSGPAYAGLPANPRLEEIKMRVREAVKARLGSSIDPALIDKIIDRVAADIGLK